MQIDNKTFKNFTPIELAGILGGLANIEYSARGDAAKRPFEYKNTYKNRAAPDGYRSKMPSEQPAACQILLTS